MKTSLHHISLIFAAVSITSCSVSVPESTNTRITVNSVPSKEESKDSMPTEARAYLRALKAEMCVSAAADCKSINSKAEAAVEKDFAGSTSLVQKALLLFQGSGSSTHVERIAVKFYLVTSVSFPKQLDAVGKSIMKAYISTAPGEGLSASAIQGVVENVISEVSKATKGKSGSSDLTTYVASLVGQATQSLRKIHPTATLIFTNPKVIEIVAEVLNKGTVAIESEPTSEGTQNSSAICPVFQTPVSNNQSISVSFAAGAGCTIASGSFSTTVVASAADCSLAEHWSEQAVENLSGGVMTVNLALVPLNASGTKTCFKFTVNGESVYASGIGSLDSSGDSPF